MKVKVPKLKIKKLSASVKVGKAYNTHKKFSF